MQLSNEEIKSIAHGIMSKSNYKKGLSLAEEKIQSIADICAVFQLSEKELFMSKHVSREDILTLAQSIAQKLHQRYDLNSLNLMLSNSSYHFLYKALWLLGFTGKINQHQPHNFISLDISSMGLPELPSTVFALQSLRELNLDYNKLVDLPSTVSGLRHLQILTIRNNHISFLPDEIGDLSNLKILDFGGNAIKKLPDSITSLSQLQKMDFSENFLETLPTNIGNMKAMVELYLQNTNIQTLPNPPFRQQQAPVH